MQQFAGLAISGSRGSFILDGLYDSSWDVVTPMTGKDTTNYSNLSLVVHAERLVQQYRRNLCRQLQFLPVQVEGYVPL